MCTAFVEVLTYLIVSYNTFCERYTLHEGNRLCMLLVLDSYQRLSLLVQMIANDMMMI